MTNGTLIISVLREFEGFRYNRNTFPVKMIPNTTSVAVFLTTFAQKYRLQGNDLK